ncbi:MAG: Lrp/AsnC family transcriptional regulator [Candidatus Thorarchaeota archaeon]
MQLDKIDKEILDTLHKYGRRSLNDISKQVYISSKQKMSHTGIAKRISKMEDAELLKIQGNINIGNLNYNSAFILMEMQNYDEIKNIVHNYSKCPRVFLLAQVTGEYDLILGIIAQSLENLLNFIDHCGPTNKGGLLHSSVIVTSEIILPKYIPLNIFSHESYKNRHENVCECCDALLEGKCKGLDNF